MLIAVKPNTYIYLVLLLFFVPFPWLTAWLAAAAFHEFCHWLAVRMLGGRICRLTVGLGGAVMESDPLTAGKNLFSVLCGPVGGFLLVLLGRWLPRVAICSWVLSVYNLLPLLPLDGGRALRILVRDEKHFLVAEKVILLLLTATAICVTFVLRIGIFPLCIVGILWLKNRNSPCKEGVCKVQ